MLCNDHTPDDWINCIYPDGPVTDKNRQERQGIWRCYGPEHGHIALFGSERKKIYLTLRILLGKMAGSDETGGQMWSDVVMSSHGAQVRATSLRGREILGKIYDIVEGGQ